MAYVLEEYPWVQPTTVGMGKKLTRAIHEEVEYQVALVKTWNIYAKKDDCIKWLKTKFIEKDGSDFWVKDLNRTDIVIFARAYACEELRAISWGIPCFASSDLFKGQREDDFFRAIAIIALFRDWD